MGRLPLIMPKGYNPKIFGKLSAPYEMTKMLLLMRHAKSSWNDPALPDFDRKLNRRGIKAAARMGAHIRETGIIPELALCSSARRARETWELVQESFHEMIEAKAMKGLYLASPNQILRVIRTVPNNVRHLLVLAHNPGVQELAHHLAADTKGGDACGFLEETPARFPTAALALFTVEVNSWSEIDQGSTHLGEFILPRELT